MQEAIVSWDRSRSIGPAEMVCSSIYPRSFVHVSVSCLELRGQAGCHFSEGHSVLFCLRLGGAMKWPHDKDETTGHVACHLNKSSILRVRMDSKMKA